MTTFKKLMVAALAQNALGLGLARAIAEAAPSLNGYPDRPATAKRRKTQAGHAKTKRDQIKAARKQRHRK